MLSTLRLRMVGYFLFCTQAFVFTNSGLAQVGIAWEPAYVTEHIVHGGGVISGGRGLGLRPLRNKTTALDFDLSDPNDVQRQILFDYYNANRYEVYSADGVSGWDTSHSWNPIRNVMRRRQSDLNLSSGLGMGMYQVEPFAKRSIHAAAIPPTHPAPASKQQHEKSKKPNHDLPTPNTAPAMDHSDNATSTDSPLQNAWPVENRGPSSLIDDLRGKGITPLPTKSLLPGFPATEKYDDVAPEFDWDDSLLDDLPEFDSEIFGQPPLNEAAHLKTPGLSKPSAPTSTVNSLNRGQVTAARAIEPIQQSNDKPVRKASAESSLFKPPF